MMTKLWITATCKTIKILQTNGMLKAMTLMTLKSTWKRRSSSL